MRCIGWMLIATTFAACGGDDGGGGNGSEPSHDLGDCKMFPAGTASRDSYSYWNQDISSAPIAALSDAYIASMGIATKVHPDFGSDPAYGIPYDTVSGDQAKLMMTFEVPDESEPGPYPIPPNAPIEGMGEGDAHVLVVDRDNCVLYEIGVATYDSGANSWAAYSGAKFDLETGALRPEGWTSADASGGSILVGLARYEEVEAGTIAHALRFTASKSQHAYIHPATHYASSNMASDVPPMGLRVRLKGSECPGLLASASPQSKVIVQALCTYGMILADNGSNYYISGATDPRWDDDDLGYLKTIPGSSFEAIETGPLTTTGS